MIQFPNCPNCGNETSALSVVDVIIDGCRLKGIQCNNCQKFLGFFQDFSEDIKKINEKLVDIISDIDDSK